MVELKEKKHWLDYQGTRICYKAFQLTPNANKPFIIFVHGFLSSQYSFRKMVPLLIEEFNIVTLDLPPFGDSDRVKNFDFSNENLAEIIIHFMNVHSISCAYISGHSMGGQVALTCAYHHPERIKKIILLAPSSYMLKADRLSWLMSFLPFFPYLIKKLFYRKGIYQTLRQCMYDPRLITKDMIVHYIKPFLDNNMYECLIKMVRDREGDLDLDCLKNINKHCLIFWGKQDEILPVSIGYRLVQDLPHADLFTFQNAGHLLPEEVPEPICGHILSKCSQE